VPERRRLVCSLGQGSGRNSAAGPSDERREVSTRKPSKCHPSRRSGPSPIDTSFRA